MQPRNLISSKLLNLLKNNVEFLRHTVFLCAKFVKWEIWYAVKLLPTKYSFSQTKQVILDIIFLVIDIAVWLREIKKYFTCYVFLRQQIIFTTKITAANEATTDLEKLQVCRSISKFLQKSGEKNVSRSSDKSFRTYILFSKDYMYDNVLE